MEFDDFLTLAIRASEDNQPQALGDFLSSAHPEHLTPDHLTTVGIMLRDKGRPLAALRVFEFTRHEWPHHIPAYYEAAFSYRITGQHLEAARLLIKANEIAPCDARVTLFLVHMLHAIGAHDEAEGFYHQAIPIAGELSDQFEAMHEFGTYLKTWPHGRAMILLDHVKQSFGYFDAASVTERIITALDQKAPFALIRLGDGEGSCVTLGQRDEFDFRTLYAQNREELTAMWFGPQFPVQQTGFDKLSRSIISTALECDIVGIPYESWINHEYHISSSRGVPSLLNILRSFAKIPTNSTGRPVLCAQQIHAELDLNGHLDRIIRHAGKISVISCLTELPALLQSHFALEEVIFYRIPGEKGSASALGQEAVTGSHFPQAFMKIQESLSQPHEGRLFLIAAGILGKFYAQTIKRHGGVALDIGSVVDGWAGKMTRPGITQEMALM